MVKHLEFERIEVDTPPPSPTLFADASLDLDDIQRVVSPTKRARSGGSSKRSKRQKKVATQCLQQVIEQVIDEVVEDSYSPNELPLIEEVLKDGYAEYITEVASGVAGLYALSDELYVVQGWDDKLYRVKVSLGLCS